MGWPRAQVYVSWIDVTFRWGRGDGYMELLRGKRAFADEGPVIAKTAVNPAGWVDNSDLYATVDRYVRENYADQHRAHGPVRPAPNAI